MKTRSGSWKAKLILLVALLLFWAAALWQVGTPSFWYDEIFNTDLVLGHDLGGFFDVLRFEQPYPPLYCLFLKGWSAALGARAYAPGLEPSNGLELLLRFPSVVAGLLTLAVLVSLARKLCLRGAAILPLLLALHPTLLWYARDARMYSLWIFWVLLAVYGLVSERRKVWVLAGAAALLTHYFSLFPLAGAALAALLFRTRRRENVSSQYLRAPGRSPDRARLWLGQETGHSYLPLFIERIRENLKWLALPFLPWLLWSLVAFRVTFGFESFATGSPPTWRTLLSELGPDLLTARVFLLPLERSPAAGWGYGLLAAALLGLFLLALDDPRRGGIVAGAVVLGVAGTFGLAQLRPVQHVRYLVWALPLLTLGLAALVAMPLKWLGRPRLAPALLGILALPALAWGVDRSRAVLQADRTVWHPDFRAAVALLNTRAQPGDRGVAVAAHGMQVFTAYRSVVPFVAGPAIGERLQPARAAQLIAPRPGRRWVLLYQDDAVDPGQVLLGTLEMAGGHRVELLYSRELRLFAYALPEGANARPLAPQTPLEAPFDGGVTLRGVSHRRAGRLLTVVLFWELREPQKQSLTGAVHLVRQAGEHTLTQQDKPVLSAYWPLPKLPVGEMLPDRYELILPPATAGVPAGDYHLFALLYDRESGARRRLPSGADMVDLGTISLP